MWGLGQEVTWGDIGLGIQWGHGVSPGDRTEPAMTQSAAVTWDMGCHGLGTQGDMGCGQDWGHESDTG